MTHVANGSVLLALYPNMSGLGYAVFEGDLRAVDWGIKTARTRKHETTVRNANALVRHFSPSHLILPARALAIEGSRRLQNISLDIERLSHACGSHVHWYSRADIKSCFSRYGERATVVSTASTRPNGQNCSRLTTMSRQCAYSFRLTVSRSFQLTAFTKRLANRDVPTSARNIATLASPVITLRALPITTRYYPKRNCFSLTSGLSDGGCAHRTDCAGDRRIARYWRRHRRSTRCTWRTCHFNSAHRNGA